MKLSLSLAVAAFLSLPGAVLAQPFEPLSDEAELNAQAMELAKSGDFEGAIALAEEAVAVRGLNVFWLNLGRFQQRAGQCAEAMESYTSAMTAPAVTDPAPEVVRKTAQQYVTELAAECPAQVTVRCTPSELRVVAQQEGDTNAPTPLLCGQQVSLAGGTWTFVGSDGSSQTETTKELRIAREYEIELALTTPTPTVESGENLELRPPPPAASKPVDPVRAALFVSAGVVAAIGLALDLTLATSKNGQLDAADFVPVGLYTTSIGLIVGGFLW